MGLTFIDDRLEKTIRSFQAKLLVLDPLQAFMPSNADMQNASHICLLRNMKEKSLAVIACDGKDTMSVRVPDGFLELHRSFKIHSKQFVYETLMA